MLAGKAPLTAILLWMMPVTLAHKYEPINTEYAPPVEVFILDLTSGISRVESGVKLFTVPEIGLEMPLTRWSQIEISIPYLVRTLDGVPDQRGIGDLGLGFRAVLARGPGATDLAFNFEVGTPTGDQRDELGGEATELAAGLFATRFFSRGLLFANFSYAAEFPKADEPHENLLEYATAVVFHPGNRVHPTLEIFGESNLTEKETELFLAPEFIFDAGRVAELKVAVPIGLTESSPDWGLQFQLTLFLGKHP